MTLQIWKVRVRDALVPRREPYWGLPSEKARVSDCAKQTRHKAAGSQSYATILAITARSSAM